MTVRILISDSNYIMREGLTSVLSTLPNVESIANAVTVQEATELCEQQCPDMAIINLESMSEEGFKIAEELHKYNNKIGAIGLFKYYENQEIIRLVRCGASAFLSTDCEPEELINAVNIVIEGGSLLNRILLPVIADLASNQLTGKRSDSKSCLTGRENEILELIIAGMTMQNIAEKLDLSVHTVYTHKRNIKDKLNASNDVQLTKNVLSKTRLDNPGEMNSKTAELFV